MNCVLGITHTTVLEVTRPIASAPSLRRALLVLDNVLLSELVLYTEDDKLEAMDRVCIVPEGEISSAASYVVYQKGRVPSDPDFSRPLRAVGRLVRADYAPF